MIKKDNNFTAIDFHDSLSSSWSSKYQKRSFSRRFDFFSHILSENIRPDSTWLDAGCGSGYLSYIFSDYQCKYIGVDASRSMIDEARNTFHAISDSFFVIDDISEISFLDDESIDGIVCSSVIEYLDNPSIAIDEFNRILKSSGVLILSVPNKFSFIRLFQKLLRLIFPSLFPYLKYSINDFTAHSLKGFVSTHGFELTKLHFLSSYPLSSLFSSLIVIKCIKI